MPYLYNVNHTIYSVQEPFARFLYFMQSNTIFTLTSKYWGPAGFSVRGTVQARMLEWVVISFSRGIFLTQVLNPGLLHCRQILCCLSYRVLQKVFIIITTINSRNYTKQFSEKAKKKVWNYLKNRL